MSQGPEQNPKPSPAVAALTECLREAACRKVTGTATVVVTLNMGGVMKAAWGIQDKQK